MGKRIEPARPVRFVLGEQALVEHDDDGLVLGGGLAEELFHSGVVVFLLGQHGNQQVGAASNVVGPFPVDAGVAVDVGGVEHHEVVGRGGAFAPEELMRRGVFECGGRIGPCDQLEPGEDIGQPMAFAETARNQADGMFCAGGEGAAGARPFAGDVVEDDAFADVRPPDDRHNQIGLVRELRPEFALQQFVPSAAGERSDAGHPRLSLQSDGRVLQPGDFLGVKCERDRHGET